MACSVLCVNHVVLSESNIQSSCLKYNVNTLRIGPRFVHMSLANDLFRDSPLGFISN